MSRKHKRSTVTETSREREKPRSKESDRAKVDVHSKDRPEKTHKALNRLSEESNTVKKISADENSPNRKLCFMETLNLTLSPIKKPVLPIDGNQDELTPVDKVLENRPDDEGSQPDVEDMCVIDEVESSELEAGLEDVEERPSDFDKTQSCEETHKKCDEDVQEKDKIQRETPVADKQLEGNSVQTTSALSHPVDTEKNQMTTHLTPKSPGCCSLKAKDEDITNNHVNKTRLASDKQVDGSEQLEANDGLSETSGSIYELHTKNSLQKVRNCTDQSVSVTESIVLDTSVEHSKTAVPRSQLISPTILPLDCQQDLCPPASSSSTHEKACCTQDGPKDADAVSSTISLESLPQEGLSLHEAIYVLTQTNEDANDSSSIATESSSSTGCIGVSKVSSTTEETALPEKYSGLTFTPKKSFSPGKSHESNVEPSSSVPLLHDEDSMMCTLSNLKRMPDAISPLRSPIRITKRNHLHVHGKPGHVKSLQKGNVALII